MAYRKELEEGKWIAVDGEVGKLLTAIIGTLGKTAEAFQSWQMSTPKSASVSILDDLLSWSPAMHIRMIKSLCKEQRTFFKVIWYFQTDI